MRSNLPADILHPSLLLFPRGMLSKGLRLLAASLMLLTGVIHLALTAFTAGTEMALMALFGLLYIAIGIGLLVSKRVSYYLGAIIPSVGACLAAYSYVVMKPELVDLPLIAIDILVILNCCYLILHKTPL